MDYLIYGSLEYYRRELDKKQFFLDAMRHYAKIYLTEMSKDPDPEKIAVFAEALKDAENIFASAKKEFTKKCEEEKQKSIAEGGKK